MRAVAPVLLALTAVGAIALGLLSQTELQWHERVFGMAPSRAAVSLAVLGDSDSHAYQDGVSFREQTQARGGRYRKTTLQWTEILDRLRADQIDSGAWGIWGTWPTIARLQRYVGLEPGRAPRKEDFRFNFAVSGAGCGALMNGPARQAPALVALMDLEPQRWRHGVVVIRLGSNSLTHADALDAFARDPNAQLQIAAIDRCVEDIRQATALIRAHHAEVRIVLVGIFDNAHWAKYLDRWRSASQLANIARAMDRYDDGLRAIAATVPDVAFFDDRAWFASRWGSRGPDGQPAYRDVVIGRGFRVANALGDHPANACVADGHAGSVWNALWAQSLVTFMNERFALALTPLTEAELARVIDPEGAFGIR